MEKKFRSFSNEIVRADKDSRHIQGHAIVFGVRSLLLPDWNAGMMVYEVIERNAISEELLSSSDVVANINHDDNQMIARSVNGQGSLKMSIDDNGLLVDIDAPKTVYGDIAYEGSMRQDFRGMSFCYTCNEDEDVTYTKEKDDAGNECMVRHVNKLSGLYDVAIVTHPAYPSTDVAARSIDEGIKKAMPELFRNQAEEEAKAKAERQAKIDKELAEMRNASLRQLI